VVVLSFALCSSSGCTKRVAPEQPDIEISAYKEPAIYGGFVWSYKAILKKDGRCTLTVAHGFDTSKRSGSDRTKIEYDLPTELYDEALNVLFRTDFFRLGSELPKDRGRQAQSGVSVKHGAKEHCITVLSPPEPSMEFKTLWSFIERMEERGKLTQRTKHAGN